MLSRVTLFMVLLAASVLPLAARQDTLQELIARADAAPPSDRPALYIEVAEWQLKSADEFYTAGKPDDARAAVNDVVTYSQKAHDSAIQTEKKLKSTEISIRKMADRLRDIKRTLNFEDQAPVQAAADTLEKLRTDLLAHMFGKGK
jgi:polyhydroxyalkanoate synthesis regulator phasin